MNHPDPSEREEGTGRTPQEGELARAPSALPREWLPEARAPEADPVWEARVARVMAAADAALGARDEARAAPPAARTAPSQAQAEIPTALSALPWWSEMGRWWKVSAGLAAASLLLFFGLPDGAWPVGAGVEGDQFALGMVVAEGDPTAYWYALGVPADPVLALLTFVEAGAEAGTEPGVAPGAAPGAEPGTAPTPPNPATPPSNPTTPPEGAMP